MSSNPDKYHNAPLYHQLKSILRDEIESGKTRPGDRVPSERELSEKYAISRMTARQALTDLVNEGLLTRQQGRGTFVARPKISQGLISLTSFTEDMTLRGMRPSTRLLRMEVLSASPRVSEVLNLGLDRRVVLFERLRLGDGEPVALEATHLPYHLGRKLTEEELSGGSLYRLFEDRIGIRLGRASQTVEASLAGAYEAGILRIREGMSLLLTERITYATTGEPVELTRSVFRGDLYKFQVDLTRQEGQLEWGGNGHPREV